MTSPRSLLTLALLASLTLPACAATPKQRVMPIGQVQGEGARSALDGQTVSVEGVVTGAFLEGLGGFFMQDSGDRNPKTSDALFIALEEGATPPTLTAGDRVRVRGIVGERKAGGDDTLTALHAPVIQLRGKGSVAPTVLTAPPADWEALEGMHVRIDAPLTLSGTHTLERFGELIASFDGRLWQPSELAAPGSTEAKRLAADNARRTLLLDDGSAKRDPATVWYMKNGQPLRTGTVLSGVQGIVDQRPGGWRLQLTAAPTITAPQRPAAPQVAGNVRVAAFNLENLFNGDGKGGGFPTERGAKTPEQLRAQLAKLTATIRGLDPDIAALMELENDGYGADSSLAQLVAALNAGGGTWRFVDAKRGPGPDSIRVGIIYRSDKVKPTGKPATLEEGPFGERSRSPLAQAFVRGNGKPFVVIANHLKSKGCSEATGLDADQKDGAGCWNALRLDSARRLDAWLKTDPTRTRSDRVVMLGDFNAYAMEDPMRWLRLDAGWVDAFKQAGVEQPYSYVYNGLTGRLDHALLSTSLAKQLRGAAEWHINADEQDAQGYADGDASVPYRSSDHDPLLLGFDL
ncbi:ExeM/NucH family extracellular endonuclease [Pseudoxanthomonas sp. LH2527]|uniref:ExeM/NucH family extracellular endonuclease n=1 Tax=Pseudoxanthomonas sp. LH2527 TaxID=2923249 RepID=UPI001F12B5B5|nr:ExeM/NucH family extracellular endonuclease [Pseudoxanthomonas sp. LH2527]MCH6483083.1 ExeM/NucH family extracellular endonuclease [Pseudoxanthomonas sp. LH2527]